MPKITIATPAYGEAFYASYVHSLFRLLRDFQQRKWGATFASISYADIAESRNFLLTRWYDKTDATHILFVDADMGFEPQLVADMVALKRPVVGAIYPKRHVDLERVVKLASEGEPAARAIGRSQEFVINRPRGAAATAGGGNFIAVQSCGAGVLLIERGAIKTMLAKIPDLSEPVAAGTANPLTGDLKRMIRAFDPIRVNGRRLPEDFSFCHRWHVDCGGEIWANVAHEITHTGPFRFKGRYRDAAPGPRVRVLATPPQKAGAGKPMIKNMGKVRVKEAAPKLAAKIARSSAAAPAAPAAASPAKSGNGARARTGIRRLFSRRDETPGKS